MIINFNIACYNKKQALSRCFREKEISFFSIDLFLTACYSWSITYWMADMFFYSPGRTMDAAHCIARYGLWLITRSSVWHHRKANGKEHQEFNRYRSGMARRPKDIVSDERPKIGPRPQWLFCRWCLWPEFGYIFLLKTDRVV